MPHIKQVTDNQGQVHQLTFDDSVSDAEAASAIRKHFFPDAQAKFDLNSSIDQQKQNDTKPSKLNFLNPVIPKDARDDLQNLAGNAVEYFGPEFIAPYKAYKYFKGIKDVNEAKGYAQLALNAAANVGKVGTATAAGEYIKPDISGQEAATMGLGAGEFTAGLTPAMMATASKNPKANLLGAGAIGATIGYGLANNYLDHGNLGAAFGGTLGAVLGLRNTGPRQLAQRALYDSMTHQQMNDASNAQQAGRQVGIPLDLGEASQSQQTIKLRNNAAVSEGGNDIIHNFATNRQKQEQEAYFNYLKSISPDNAKTNLEDPAFKHAEDTARANGTKFDVKPILNWTQNELNKSPMGSDMANTLKGINSKFNITPNTLAEFNKKNGGLSNNYDSHMQAIVDSHGKQTAELERLKGMESPITRKIMPDYDLRVANTQKSIADHESLYSFMAKNRNKFVPETPTLENQLGGLHRAKIELGGMIKNRANPNALNNYDEGFVKNAKEKLTDILHTGSPEYHDATVISGHRQARQAIEKKMVGQALTGQNLNKNIFQNETEYNDMYRRLGDTRNPKATTMAQENMAKLKLVLPKLLDNLADKSGYSMASENPSTNFNVHGLMKHFTGQVFFKRYNHALAEIITNPHWKDELDSIIRDKGEDRGIRLGRLVSKVATIGATNIYGLSQQGQ